MSPPTSRTPINDLAELLHKEVLPEIYGQPVQFVMLVFTELEAGRLDWISTVEREDANTAVAEWFAEDGPSDGEASLRPTVAAEPYRTREGSGVATMKITKKLYADGREEECEETWPLDKLQQFVGGYIEMVSTTIPHRSLIVNEEGALENLPVNHKATALVPPGTAMLLGVRGDALLVKS